MPRRRQVQNQGSPQLEQVLAIMLQGGHLTAEERLACFCCSKAMAELVLRHAACTHLELVPPATAYNSTSSNSRSFRAHAKASQLLAAQCNNVKLTLYGGLLTPASCLWQRITTLQLHGIQLGQASCSQLQLHRLPRLHTLSLQWCAIAPFRPCRSISVRILECMNCSGSLPFAVLELVDPSQLQTVITDDTLVTTLMPQLPALQELHMNISSLDEYAEVDDEGFQRLLAHPRLARVQLARVRLLHSHADKACAWESLYLPEGVCVTDLGRMPLAGMRSCIVHHLRITRIPGDVPAIISSISRAQHLVFQAGPIQASTEGLEPPSEPCFEVSPFINNDHVNAQVITLVMSHLAPGTVLLLGGLDVGSPEVVASLATAPATLRTVCFRECYAINFEGAGVAEAGVLTHMPHVDHVQLCTGAASRYYWLNMLRAFVTGVSRAIRLTLTLRPYALARWCATDQEEIRRWVAVHASEHVHVEFRQEEYCV